MGRLRIVAPIKAAGIAPDIAPLLPEQVSEIATLLYQSEHPDVGVVPLLDTLKGCYQYVVAVMCNAAGKYLPYASFVAMEPELSGFVLTTETAPHEGHIVQIAVAPEMRRAGIGKRLIQAAMSALYDTGYKTVSLNVTEANIPAIRLYTAMGFERENVGAD